MPHSDAATPADAFEFVSLITGEQNYCIAITRIREIRRWSPVTTLPQSPGYVLGVINLRGAVIPIVDLAGMLGMDMTSPTQRHVIIIANIGDRTVGLLVDSVSEILSVDADDIRPTPHSQDDTSVSSISGLIPQDEGMIKIIDLDALFPDTAWAAA